MAEINDTELAELRKKAHAYDSEQGRLQKTQGELDAERAARAELEKRIAAQQATQPPQFGVDPRATEVFGADGVTVLQSMLSPISQMAQKLDAIGRKFEERDTAEAQARAARTFQDALSVKLAENNLPGFTARLTGDLGPEWSKFMESRPSIKRAWGEGDVEAVSDAVATFIHQNKELVAGGGFAPSAASGFAPAVKSEYSDTDYMRDMDALQRKLDNLSIDETEFKKQSATCYDRYVAAQQKAEKAASAYGLV